nr:hypothetical protein B0A51_03096 [Rachicladosporium sp. CCFEE 5018]
MANVQGTHSFEDLNDLELAIVLSLTAQQHCIVFADRSTDNLLRELQATIWNRFAVQSATVLCTATTTVDELNESLLVTDDSYERSPSDAGETQSDSQKIELGHAQHEYPGRRHSSSPSNGFDNRTVADIVLARNLDLASESVQVQVLELLRSKRVFTRTAMHTAPSGFIMIAVLSTPGARLTKHLHDVFATSHMHEEMRNGPVRLAVPDALRRASFMQRRDIEQLRSLAATVHMTAEVAAYLHNIVLFMRLSRYITAGVTPTATMHLRCVAHALAPLHGLDYVPPSLVALAARKVYGHRLVLATPQTERSLQWGSDPEAVSRMLEGVTVDDVIDRVLEDTDAPL